MDRFGFPRTRAKRRGKVAGLQTGDLVLAQVLRGQHQGRHRGRLAVRASGSCRVGQADGIPARCCRLLQRADGYAYA